ncbi:GATA transcription factor 26 [Platanthera guangdongensis]|uniref:GATA transcription factor 26 n=1 Tax=Platanthera guangdongensis TaxID=2320717 RepID=A0ABR2LJT4_9ASPA
MENVLEVLHAISGSAQSNRRDSLVLSKKRSLIRSKPSSVEKLTKDLYSIWHEQQSSNLSGISDDDLLFESELIMGSEEIGHGGVLLGYPRPKVAEEESEASSLPSYDKDNFSPEILNILQERDPLLLSANLELTRGEKNLSLERAAVRGCGAHIGIHVRSSCDSTCTEREKDRREGSMERLFMRSGIVANYIDTSIKYCSLKSMFSSPQFLECLSHFQQLLQEGIFDLSTLRMSVEECRTLKRLVLLNFIESRWVLHYKEIKDKKDRQVAAVKSSETSKSYFHYSISTPSKRHCESKDRHLLASARATHSIRTTSGRNSSALQVWLRGRPLTQIRVEADFCGNLEGGESHPRGIRRQIHLSTRGRGYI